MSTVVKFYEGDVYEVQPGAPEWYGRRLTPGERWTLVNPWPTCSGAVREGDLKYETFGIGQLTDPRYWLHVASRVPSTRGAPVHLGEAI